MVMEELNSENEIHNNGNCSWWHNSGNSTHKKNPSNSVPKWLLTVNSSRHLSLQNTLSFGPFHRSSSVMTHSSSHDSSYHTRNTLSDISAIFYHQHFHWNDTSLEDQSRSIQCMKKHNYHFDHFHWGYDKSNIHSEMKNNLKEIISHPSNVYSMKFILIKGSEEARQSFL